MDTRSEHGQYWPGTRTGGGEAPTPADNGKVDRVDLGTLAPDATASEMRTAIRNIQNAIRPLATMLAAALCGIALAQTAPWDGMRGGAPVVTNEQDAVALERIVAATNDVATKMSEMRSGIEDEIAAATNGLPEQIAAATNGLPERMEAMLPNLSSYALKTEIPDVPDLTPYALKSELPPTPDLSGYATKYEVGLATNGIPAQIAATTNGIPAKIAAVTNGLPQRIAAVTNGMPEKIVSLSSQVSLASLSASNYTDAVAGRLSARMQEMSTAFAASNTATRLSTPDGGTFQDATGVVWRVENFQVPGLFNFEAIEYFTNGVYMAETNALPAGINWTMWEGYDNGTWEIVAGESGREEDAEEHYREWNEFTNHVAAADMEDKNKFYYILQLEIAGEETELTTNEALGTTTLRFDWPMSNTNVARFLIFARTNVTATALTQIDRVLHASEGYTAGNYEIVSNRAMSAVLPSALNLFPLARYDSGVADESTGWYPEIGTIVSDSRNGRIYKVINIGWDDGEYPWYPTGETYYFEDVTTSGELPPNLVGATNRFVTASITNNLPTKAQIETGWLSDWNISGSMYNSNLTYTVNYNGVIWEVNDGNEHWGAIAPADATYINFRDGELIITRHRVAAPVPTKTSDLTNDGDGTNAFATVSEVFSSATASTNYTDSAISSADTTYKSFALTVPTNVNQSVQFLNIEDPTPSTIDIPLPAGGGTKDWIIYIYAATNVTLRLPAATWWMADAANTNDIAPATPTALYFSEIGSGKYLFSRQELTEVVTQ